MSCEQLVAQLGMDDETSGIFSIDEVLCGPEIDSNELEDLDQDDWFELLEDIDAAYR